MKTAKEMNQYQIDNQFAIDVGKGALRAFTIIENALGSDENVVLCFTSSLVGVSASAPIYAFAITNKRILRARKKRFGENLHVIDINSWTDIRRNYIKEAIGFVASDNSFAIPASNKNTEALFRKLNDILNSLKRDRYASSVKKKQKNAKNHPALKHHYADKKTVKQEIANGYYAGYPEMPYISPSRDLKDWLEKVDMFPGQSLVAKSMMKRNADGLLPGHVYMLYWMKKFTDKAIPAYFEYKYGIDFEKEKLFLLEGGYLGKNDKPTALGENIISKYASVISTHDPQKSTTDAQKLKEAKARDLQAQELKVKYGIEPIDDVSNYQFQLWLNDLEKAKRLAIDKKDYEGSNAILWRIYKEGYDYPAVFDRLGKNYRKLKDLESELEVLYLNQESVPECEWTKSRISKIKDSLGI